MSIRDEKTGRFVAESEQKKYNTAEDIEKWQKEFAEVQAGAVKKEEPVSEIDQLRAELKAKEERLKVLEAEEKAKALEAKKKAEDEKALARKAEAVKVQDAANAYLNLVEENNKIRAELNKKQADAYAVYIKMRDDFAAKNNGYHLTYKIKDGKTVEFKVEEARADEFNRILKEQTDFYRDFYKDFLNDFILINNRF